MPEIVDVDLDGFVRVYDRTDAVARPGDVIEFVLWGRNEMPYGTRRNAFACYLQLVLLEREAGAALNAALEGPVTVAGAWPFRRVGAALDRARRGQQQPWRTLAELGEQIGVADLVDLAHSAQIAGTEGAKMHGVLTAKVTAMRHEAAATTRAEANARTTAMWVPTSLLMLGFVVLVGFPFFSRLVGSG